MKNSHLLILIAVVGAVFFFFSRHSAKKPKNLDTDDEVAAVAKPQKPNIPVMVSGALKSSDLSAAAPITAATSEAAAVKFATHMQEMGKCLGFANQTDKAAKIEPVPDNLVGALRTSLGDAVVQMDDWSQMDVIEKNGSIKKIRVDYDYTDGVTPARRLSMYTVNAYGAAELMELTEDQANNPNESYIQSLSEGLQIAKEERAGRVYFSQGEELMFTMKNGKLQTFSVTRGNKNFSCADLGDESSQCVCP